MVFYVTRFEILLINIINGFLIYYEKNNVYCDFFSFYIKFTIFLYKIQKNRRKNYNRIKNRD